MAILYLVVQNAEGSRPFYAWQSTVTWLGEITLAAGVCALAAGIWKSVKRPCWPLVLTGLALGALGVIYCDLIRYSISFRVIACLITLMAMSIGVLELLAARTLRLQHHIGGGWFLIFAGAASFGFALAFFAMGFRWLKLSSSAHSDFLWFASYFAVSAVCMFGLAVCLRRALPAY